MKRRNLLLGSISAAAIAVVGKNVVKAEPEKAPLATSYDIPPETKGTSGYRVLQQIAERQQRMDRIVAEQLAKQPWYQDLIRQRVLLELNPPMVLMRPDGPAEYIPTPPNAWKVPQEVLIRSMKYGYIDAPYQAKRKAAMDAEDAKG